MPAPVPLGWLHTLAQAWPLRSELAFRSRLEALAPSEMNGSCSALRSDLLEELRTAARGVSHDVLELAIDRAWFDGHRREVYLNEHVVSMAHELLEFRGATVVFRSHGDGPYADSTERWRWSSLALPAELLVAARCIERHELPADAVDPLTPHLREVLARDVALTHVHLSAAQRFSSVWHRLMVSPDGGEGNPTMPAPFGTLSDLRSWLRRASVARVFMAWFLGAPLRRRGLEDFGPEDLDTLAVHLMGSSNRGALGRTLRNVLAAFTTGRVVRAVDVEESHLLGWLYADSRDADELRGDPVARLLRTGTCEAVEPVLTHAGMRYLDSRQGCCDRLFGLLFWQYQRVKCQLFSWLTQQPGTAGLSWFTQHFDRIHQIGAWSPSPFAEALRLERRGLGLAALEVRAGPGNGVVSKVGEMARSALALAEEVRPEIGLVLHVIKAGAEGLPKQNKKTLCRFGDWYHEQSKEIGYVEQELEVRPMLLMIIRGVDMASQELPIPNWVVLRLLRRLRQASFDASFRLRHRWRVEPFRATAHVGEDFRSLHEGLRRIAELLAHGVLREGDRLGHAIAAGVEPKSWAHDNPVVLQPRGERVADLLWELDLYEKGQIDGRGARICWVEAQIRELGCPIVERLDDASTDPLEVLRRLGRLLRKSPGPLDTLNYPFLDPMPPTNCDLRLLWRYLRSNDVYQVERQAVEVRTVDADVEMLTRAQERLRRELAHREITIEANPSSNLIVGDLGSITEHPAFKLCPIQTTDARQPSLLVSINDDDPITFATSLVDEYAYLYGALLKEGIPADAALAWLERAKRAGYRSRFTLAESRQTSVLEGLKSGS